MTTQLDPARIKICRRELGLYLAGDERGPVTVLRMFPLSAPDQFWRLETGAREEVGIIVEPEQVEEASRALLQEELARRYFIPVIRRILAVEERAGNLDWTVETDRGHRTFTTRLLREVTVQPGPGRYLITDIEGNRYDVPQLSQLDNRSRLHLMAFL